MLELKHIRKVYHVGDIDTVALNDISVAFREKEFVAILGTSGSGKTTCLNIIGGLDRYDSGDLVIKGKKTKDFKETDWDAYRNNSIGFVFQSYNLIMHLSIVENVELGMTLSGVSKEEKHKRALEVLEQVGLKNHVHKKPNQLSGGQMQRVAIARALANDPEILLCDEPTGALDTATSVQIMDLIKEVAKDRLVIMVTHNPELAEQYADRIIRFQDGNIISDSHPHQERPKEDQFKLKKTSMKFMTALGLSLNNLKTKKGRTFLTAFASSIGIIGIAVILSLSTGFQTQINNYQSDAMSEFPVIITQSTSEVDMEKMQQQHAEAMGEVEYPDTDEVKLYDPMENIIIHKNDFTNGFIDYIEAVDPKICSSIGYTRLVNMNLVMKKEDSYIPVMFGSLMSSASSMSSMTSMSGIGLSSYPNSLHEGESYLEKNYELLAGEYPTQATDLILVIEPSNKINVNTMMALGFETEDVENIKFSDIVGTEYKLVGNNDYYSQVDYNGANVYMPGTDYEAMYQAEGSKTLTITGVVRQKEGTNMGLLATGIAYSDDLSQLVIDDAMESDIVKAQKEVNYNVMSMEEFADEDTKDMFVSYLGGDATPFMVLVFPKDFESKDKILEYLDQFNEGKEADDQIVYTDLAGTISDMTSGIMDGITVVLIAFASISLVVSLIMICIITYTSVLERTKEIGILKALGARKKDITRVFDAETCLLGIFSGTLGVFIAWLCTFPINVIIEGMTELQNCSHLQLKHAVALVIISTILTMIGGHIPAKMAAKKDAVEALRSE
ncbi:MAG: ATP-binding cassette domain-containing protein [Lachnospiraceae bacterium]|nr:ATP-binding cassette domain-containing protein [Lachnospiraceae bacterium]